MQKSPGTGIARRENRVMFRKMITAGSHGSGKQGGATPKTGAARGAGFFPAARFGLPPGESRMRRFPPALT
jgi:hypothetical protein